MIHCNIILILVYVQIGHHKQYMTMVVLYISITVWGNEMHFIDHTSEFELDAYKHAFQS